MRFIDCKPWIIDYNSFVIDHKKLGRIFINYKIELLTLIGLNWL